MKELKKGETVIGDDCYWCCKNPNKITCDISTTNIGTYKE